MSGSCHENKHRETDSEGLDILARCHTCEEQKKMTIEERKIVNPKINQHISSDPGLDWLSPCLSVCLSVFSFFVVAPLSSLQLLFFLSFFMLLYDMICCGLVWFGITRREEATKVEEK